MADTLLNWVLRGVMILFGVGAALALVRWFVTALRERRERWAQRIAFAMVLLAVVYAVGHARLLWDRDDIEAGRAAYARFGDPRLAELNRAELRGWILDCTGRDDRALARYGVQDGQVSRVYPLGEGAANLVGGGDSAEVRDYTVERLYASQLRRPFSFAEQGELHPAGTDLRLTLCGPPMLEASRLLAATRLQGAVVVQEVGTGALVAYAATGTASQPPFGVKRYALPGSVFKLALSALWWDAGIPDERLPCPSEIVVNGKPIHNFESHAYPSLLVPRQMLIVSCNTQAIAMALQMRRQLGPQAIADGFKRLGFEPYDEKAPPSPDDFWNTENASWLRRMNPPPNRLRLRQRYNEFEFAQEAIGQGPVDVTPIGISRFVQAIGNGGVMLPVTLESARLKQAGEGRAIMKPGTAAKLQSAMLAVVDSGTAIRAVPILEGTGWDMGGKTGTADVRRGHVPDGWFAGLMFGPDGRAKYTVVVYLQNAGQGGRIPATLAANLTRFMAQQQALEAHAAQQAEPAGATQRKGGR